MSTMPDGRQLRISIVTPSYNQARFLREAIDSVLGQEGAFELEYLVIDGGSRDGTLGILKEYSARLQWVSERDLGQVDAINKGLARCTGDVVGWLNSDDVLLPGALDRVAQTFLTRPEVDWVHGRCWIIDEHGRRIRRWIEAYKHYRAMHHSFENLLVENYVNQMTVLWRRSLLQAVGSLDPRFPLAFDYELWLKFARRSPPAYIEVPQACFRWYEASKSGSNFVRQLAESKSAAGQYALSGRGVSLRRGLWNAAAVCVYKALTGSRRAAGMMMRRFRSTRET